MRRVVTIIWFVIVCICTYFIWSHNIEDYNQRTNSGNNTNSHIFDDGTTERFRNAFKSFALIMVHVASIGIGVVVFFIGLFFIKKTHKSHKQ